MIRWAALSALVLAAPAAAQTPDARIGQFWEQHGECQAGTGPAREVEAACRFRDALGRQLREAGYCLGLPGQSGNNVEWARCRQQLSAVDLINSMPRWLSNGAAFERDFVGKRLVTPGTFLSAVRDVRSGYYGLSIIASGLSIECYTDNAALLDFVASLQPGQSVIVDGIISHHRGGYVILSQACTLRPFQPS